MEVLGNASMLFVERFQGDSPLGVKLSPDDIQSILKASDWNQKRDGDLMVMEKDSSTKKPIQKQQRTQVTAPELVLQLSLALQAEMAEIAFDYFTLHRICWDTLRILKKALDTDMRRWFDAAYLEEENQLPFLIGYMFMAAIGKAGNMLGEPLWFMTKSVAHITDVIDRRGSEVRKSLAEVGIALEVEVDSELEDMPGQLDSPSNA